MFHPPRSGTRNARTAKLPLYQYLGAVAYRPRARLCQRRLLPGWQDARTSWATRWPATSPQGFKAVKMKVGRLLAPAQEEERIARRARGDRPRHAPDARRQQRLVGPADGAALHATRYEPYEPYWIEEPFSARRDRDPCAARAAHPTIPVATGEIEVGRWRFKELLDKDSRADPADRPSADSSGGSMAAEQSTAR